ncbi:aspartate carbamoyltransferase catalytic subunit [Qingshengfaniella alkalisoli]|uniref:Aspartate carbamoyltransferase catalytic subunit n=1 Tax=Qingshengfaniella alkalisoli TaxID=2599296 RepID=A0A5B8I7R4_9RHOB|nr:aspartate carbamoyltransferase catalytic subunit [Qingshengfaniella alkalisoli]QDY68566.1 aspartate carbamoyltransferase catalytic subunit [Qingshengfaniella alkalisoli]
MIPTELSGDWTGILQPGERILWQGRPDGRLVWSDVNPKRSVFGFIIVIFALSWMMGAATVTSGDPFVSIIFFVFGMLFVFLGLQRAFGYVVRDAWERSRSWYTLTDSRAIIATDTFGKRRLNSFDVTADTTLTLEDGVPGAVFFGRSFGSGSSQKVGFKRIDDPRHVYDLMRKVQRGQA